MGAMGPIASAGKGPYSWAAGTHATGFHVIAAFLGIMLWMAAHGNDVPAMVQLG